MVNLQVAIVVDLMVLMAEAACNQRTDDAVVICAHFLMNDFTFLT